MTTAPATGSDTPVPPLPDLEAMAQVADAGMLLCERMALTGLSMVDGFVTLTSRQADAMMTGNGTLDEFWREESTLVQAWGSTLVDCAGECGNLILTTHLLLQDHGQTAEGSATTVVQGSHKVKVTEPASSEAPFAAPSAATAEVEPPAASHSIAPEFAAAQVTATVAETAKAPSKARAATGTASPAAGAAEHPEPLAVAEPAPNGAKRASGTTLRPTSPRRPTRPG